MSCVEKMILYPLSDIQLHISYCFAPYQYMNRELLKGQTMH